MPNMRIISGKHNIRLPFEDLLSGDKLVLPLGSSNAVCELSIPLT